MNPSLSTAVLINTNTKLHKAVAFHTNPSDCDSTRDEEEEVIYHFLFLISCTITVTGISMKGDLYLFKERGVND